MIISITFNWAYSPELGQIFEEKNIGYNHVLEIQEHKPEGEGDRFYYDIIFDNGYVERIFNPNRVCFKEEQK